MVRYSDELKDQLARRMLPPHNRSVSSLSRESGVSQPTLYLWRKQFRDRGFPVADSPPQPGRWDARGKLAAVIQTADMNEVERSAWCREHGLYPGQLEAWKQAFEAMESDGAPATRRDVAAARQQIRQLEKELRRKEKALAEAEALLTLSKKAQAILGTDADN